MFHVKKSNDSKLSYKLALLIGRESGSQPITPEILEALLMKLILKVRNGELEELETNIELDAESTENLPN